MDYHSIAESLCGVENGRDIDIDLSVSTPARTESGDYVCFCAISGCVSLSKPIWGASPLQAMELGIRFIRGEVERIEAGRNVVFELSGD